MPNSVDFINSGIPMIFGGATILTPSPNSPYQHSYQEHMIFASGGAPLPSYYQTINIRFSGGDWSN